MKHAKKPITRELVKKYFGEDATVIGFTNHFRVTTPGGGEVIITPHIIRRIYGGHNIYRAIVLLAGECWNGGHAWGCDEFVAAAVAHGEAWGVDIEPSCESSGATFVRWVVAIAIVYGGCSAGDQYAIPALFIAFLVVVAMKRNTRSEQQQRLDERGFTMPKQTSGARFATDEDLKKGRVI